MVYYERKSDESITGDRYQLQLITLNEASIQKRPQYERRDDKVSLQHDNARLHVVITVKIYLQTLKWEVLHYSPHSPDISTLNIHVFRSKTHD